MKVMIEGEFDNVIEMQQAIAKFLGAEKVSPKQIAAIDDDEDEKPKGKRGRPAKNKTKITESDIRKALRNYAKENGKEAAMEILQEFGADNVAELDSENYSELLANLAI